MLVRIYCNKNRLERFVECRIRFFRIKIGEKLMFKVQAEILNLKLDVIKTKILKAPLITKSSRARFASFLELQ